MYESTQKSAFSSPARPAISAMRFGIATLSAAKVLVESNSYKFVCDSGAAGSLI